MKGAGLPPNRIVFSEKFACPVSGFTIAEIEPRLFSFNNPFGACPTCHGFGNIIELDMDLVVPDPSKSINQGAIEPWSKPHYRSQLAELKRSGRKAGMRGLLRPPRLRRTARHKTPLPCPGHWCRP